MKYEAYRDGGDRIEFTAGSSAMACEFAEEWVAKSNLPISTTSWVRYGYRLVGESEWIEDEVTVDPPEPDCIKGRKHRWREPWGMAGWKTHGPTKVCKTCGMIRHTGPEKHPHYGIYTSLSYLPPTKESKEWVAKGGTIFHLKCCDCLSATLHRKVKSGGYTDEITVEELIQKIERYDDINKPDENSTVAEACEYMCDYRLSYDPPEEWLTF